MRKLLLVVDYQHDFVADDGKLTVGAAAQKIEEAIYEKVKWHQGNGHRVLFTMDAHEETDWDMHRHPEGNVFARHCIKGTSGYDLHGRIRSLAPCDDRVNKRAYCPDMADEKLSAAIHSADEIEICGVVTDICVFQTVMGLYTYIINEGLAIRLRVDARACASFNTDREKWALAYMEEVLQVTIDRG